MYKAHEMAGGKKKLSITIFIILKLYFFYEHFGHAA